MDKSHGKNVLIQILVGIVFLIMSTEMVFLVRRNRELAAENQKLRVPQIETVAIGTPAPDFRLKNLSDVPTSLSDYSGTNLLLIFFSTDCSACLADIPNWKRLASLECDTLHILGISQGDPEEIQSFLNSYAIDMQVAVDPGEQVRRMYKSRSVPQKILIDRKGRIAHVEAGAIQHNEIGELERLLKSH